MAQTKKSVVYWVGRETLKTFHAPRSTYAALVRTADEEVASYVSTHLPVARVCLLRVQPRGTGEFHDGVSRPLDGRPDRAERLMAEELVWDLASLGRTMILAVGRNPDCHFKPAVDLSQRFFTQPHPSGLGYRDEFDPAVSREHAWIFCEGPAQLSICFPGTPDAPGNGAWRNDEERVLARCLPWAREDFFGIGQVCKNAPNARPPYISIFRLRWTAP